MITPAGVVNPGFALLGNNVVTYMVNTGPCVNTATSVLNVNQFRSAALTGSISNLCSNSGAVNLSSIVQQPIGAWSGGGVSQGVFSPQNALAGYSGAIPADGVYTFTLTYNTVPTPNPNAGCSDFRNIVVAVLNPITPVIAQPAPHCNVDAPFQIQVSPNTGSFSPTPYLTAGGLFTPSLSPVGNNMVQYTIGTSTCNVQDSKQVSIEAYIPAMITGSLPDQCNTNVATNLSAFTSNNLGTWVGQGMIGSTFNPGLSGAGNIVLSYNTSSFPSGLCPAQATLAVNVYSLATPSIENEGPFCNSRQAIQLRVTPLGGLFSGENNRGVDVLGRFSPANAEIGNNIVNYSITAGPCVAYAQTVIKVEKFISADFLKYAPQFCKNAPSFDLNSLAQNPGGEFSNFVGLGVDKNTGMFNPATANIGNSNVIQYWTYSSPTKSLCPDSKLMTITVNDVPQVSIASNTDKGCVPVEVVFNVPQTNTGKGEWTLGDGSESIKGLTVNHTYSSPGTYTVLFNYEDNLGCKTQAILEKPITVYSNPTAGFSYGPYGNDLTISDPEVQFTNLSNELGGNTYQWQMDSLFTSTDVNPTFKFPAIGEYKITLLATSIYGCKDKTTQTLEIKNDFGIFIPNTFTPNDDGLNDVFIPVFTPYGLDAKTFEMEIFDRWGASLYQTKDVTKGWNGSIQNKGTEPLKEEVFVYKIKYKDMNGIIYNKLGYVTLVK
jgi:gliding motility-associated-like protein